MSDFSVRASRLEAAAEKMNQHSKQIQQMGGKVDSIANHLDMEGLAAMELRVELKKSAAKIGEHSYTMACLMSAIQEISLTYRETEQEIKEKKDSVVVHAIEVIKPIVPLPKPVPDIDRKPYPFIWVNPDWSHIWEMPLMLYVAPRIQDAIIRNWNLIIEGIK